MSNPLGKPSFLTIALIATAAATLPGCYFDLDGDGVTDPMDQDTDGDGISNAEEGGVDTDMDGWVDSSDADADGDSVPDLVEANDADADGYADVAPVGADTDGDGIDDAYDLDCAELADCEGIIGVEPARPDFDGDGTPDYLDTDSDQDGVSDSDESGDANEDGVPDYLQHCCLVTVEAPGLINATFFDHDNDGQFDATTTGGSMRLSARRVDYTNRYWTHRAIIEFDMSALQAGARIVDAELMLYRLGSSFGSGFDVQLRGYSGDGAVTLEDAEAGPNVDASFTVDRDLPFGRVNVDVTDLVQTLVDQQATVAGINLRASSEPATYNTDDEFIFPNLNSSSQAFPPPALTISYTP